MTEMLGIGSLAPEPRDGESTQLISRRSAPPDAVVDQRRGRSRPRLQLGVEHLLRGPPTNRAVQAVLVVVEPDADLHRRPTDEMMEVDEVATFLQDV